MSSVKAARAVCDRTVEHSEARKTNIAIRCILNVATTQLPQRTVRRDELEDAGESLCSIDKGSSFALCYAKFASTRLRSEHAAMVSPHTGRHEQVHVGQGQGRFTNQYNYKKLRCSRVRGVPHTEKDREWCRVP